MEYSFSTILMTIAASNLIIVLMTLCFNYNKIILSVGCKVLAVFLIFTLVRFLFPFELPFTKSIYFSGIIAKCILYFQHWFYKIGFFEVSLWSVAKCVWLVGIAVKLCKHIWAHQKIGRSLSMFGKDVSLQEPYRSLLQKICGRRRDPFRILLLPSLDVPQIYGIFSPRILLPKHMELSEEELSLVLRHETYHYYHCDLLIKEIVNLLCILYWWNPACKIFKEQVALILEMHVDDALIGDLLTDNHANPQDDYFRSLVHLAESASLYNNLCANSKTALVNNDKEELAQRIEMMAARNKKPHKPMLLALTAMVATIYIASYCVIFEASSYGAIAPEPEGIEISEAFYAYPREDGLYDIYYNDCLIETVESLDYYRDLAVLSAD